MENTKLMWNFFLAKQWCDTGMVIAHHANWLILKVFETPEHICICCFIFSIINPKINDTNVGIVRNMNANRFA